MPRPRTTSDAAVLAATGRAIARHGLAGLTLASVAEQAGLSPATLVQRFGSKRGLLLAFAEHATAGARAPFTRARQEHDSPLTALRAAISSFARVRSRAELANHLTFLHLDLTDSEFLRHAQAHAEVMHTEIAQLLAEAVGAGELVDGCAVDQLTRAVRAVYHGSLVTWALTGDGPLPTTVQANLDTLLNPYRKEQT